MSDNKIVFAKFAEKAKEKIEARKKLRTQKIYIPDIEETITIRAVTDQEINDINDFSEDSNKNDAYMIYMACPELQTLANTMIEANSIKEHIEVIDMFTRADKRYIAKAILTLSGVYEDSNIKVISEVDEVKNS